MSRVTLTRVVKLWWVRFTSSKEPTAHPVDFPLSRSKKRPLISLLIPFSSRNHLREATFEWLLKYWAAELPDAEVVIGTSRNEKVFCKGAALNRAAKRARGEVLVILDADAYLPGTIIARCAERVIEELPHHLWYVPYRHLYRLTKAITKRIIESDPSSPLRLSHPPFPSQVDPCHGDKSGYGHRFGAMITIIPRQALDVLGCFDERFKGWGGEDVAILRALDTLYGLHKTTDNDVLHLWHPFLGHSYKTRKWRGQSQGNINGNLAMRYHKATGRPAEMRALVDEGCKKIKLDRLF